MHRQGGKTNSWYSSASCLDKMNANLVLFFVFTILPHKITFYSSVIKALDYFSKSALLENYTLIFPIGINTLKKKKKLMQASIYI